MKRSKPNRRRSLRNNIETLEPRITMAANSIVPVVGNWDGSLGDSVGLFDRSTGQLFTKATNAVGFADVAYTLASKNSTFIPLTGDWNGDGVTTGGTFDPTTGTFAIRNKWSVGKPDTSFQFSAFVSGMVPIVGDWNGDGKDSVGLFNPATGQFALKDQLKAGAADYVFSLASGNNLTAIAGDWNADGQDTVAIVNRSTGEISFTNSNVAPSVEQTLTITPFASTDVVIVGDWDGDGRDTLGLYDASSSTFSLDTTGSGVASQEFYVIASVDPTAPITKKELKAAAKSAALAAVQPVITVDDVKQLLSRAAAASLSQNAIIVVVDRGGNILGVRMEQEVLDQIPDVATRVFAIDGAVAKARTAAFFANGDPTNDKKGTIGPLTSRTVRFISQSTITEREVESNPNIPDPTSTIRGPGFVAPVGLGGHYPPGIFDAPVVDLFAIEHTNRDSIIHPGLDGIKGVVNGVNDDINLPSRFNVPTTYIEPGQGINAPESFGYTSGWMLTAQARGIATLPGGVPLYKLDSNGDPWLVGGIGVFFPGTDGYATFEQGFLPDVEQTELERTNAPHVLEAEWMAVAAAGATDAVLGGVPPVPDYFFPKKGRIDLAGVTLEIFGPGNSATQGLPKLFKVGKEVGPAPNGDSGIADQWLSNTDGQVVPDGWLVLPHDSPSGSVTAADVIRLVTQGIAQAGDTRAQIRLQLTKNPTPGATTRMVFAVTDEDGNVLGLYRMQDATFFSIDVSVAKARNVAYYANANELQDIDRVDDNHDGIPDPSVPAGTAFTSRTFRFLAEGRYPSGIDGSQPGAFSIMFDPGFRNDLLESHDPKINSNAVLNAGTPQPANVYQSVLGFDSFHPGRNFHDPYNIANQNGVVFFPGSTPIYKSSLLVGGFGVSGDGVDQDDVVTSRGSAGFGVPDSILSADDTWVRGVRLPFIKFSRNPEAL